MHVICRKIAIYYNLFQYGSHLFARLYLLRAPRLYRSWSRGVHSFGHILACCRFGEDANGTSQVARTRFHFFVVTSSIARIMQPALEGSLSGTTVFWPSGYNLPG